uniref:Uncharacterized protein n=1 Tax=Timema monikensis TaxID=170555 RepID=A0A7R9E956_9NEOP|nr:unnamed protein product [Timema monikensis]
MDTKHAISEIITFFQTRSVSLQDVVEWSKQHLMKASEVARGLVEYTIVRNTTTHFTMDLKGPYFVIPELGSVQKGGSVMVVDLGRVVVSSDIQPSNAVLEDATQMELEERLYDRLHLDCSDLQLIFCDSGEEWREVRKQQDSDHHLVPKIRCQVVFSNSIKPDYRQMPKHKLNVSLSSLKLNLSDRKIGMVLDFLDNLPLPSTNTVRVCDAEILSEQLPNLAADLIIPELTKKHLMQVKQSLACILMSFISSDHSDEENELWARTVDLPGFDDNVSPRNTITMLLRFNVGEVVIQLARSNNLVDKPYLMLRVTKLCCDTALMEYGPAIQASIGGVKLIDKIHTGCSGEYLELVSTDHEDDMVTLLYRKVQADCPDFKSHFFSVEQSLVLDFSSVNVVFHREAFCTLNKYLQYLLQKISSRDMVLKILPSMPTTALLWLLSGEKDPPIPPGATKFSYSTRLGEIKLKLCDTELEFLEIRVTGMESDCLFKANERMVLRIYLTTISVDDLSDMTLYPKILAIEEDKVFEFKYVRHSPRLYSQSNLGPSNKDDVKSDGSLRLHIGRLHIVLLYKLLVDLQIFLEPFIPPGLVPHYFNLAERTVEQHISQLRGWSTKLHLSLGLHFPTFLLPQKTASPNLIIVNMGDLSVENFFKEVSSVHVSHSNSGSSPASDVPVIDNILIRLEFVQMSRAVMTLAGSLEIQEPILEPMSVRLDVKRTVAYHHTVSSQQPPAFYPHRDLLLFEVDGGMENVRVNLGQRDLATLLAVWSDNLAEGMFIGHLIMVSLKNRVNTANIRLSGRIVLGSGRISTYLGNRDSQENTEVPLVSRICSPLEAPTPTNPMEDSAMKKLQAFFYHSEQVRKETSIRLNLDGLQLYLFSDMDEVLSSPVRDLNHGLCKLDVGEATLSLDIFSDHSLESKIILQCCLLEDIRPDNNIVIKKIFQSHGGEKRVDSSPISVSTPPIVDVSFRQSQSGDKCVDVLVEKTRLNLSVPFLMHLVRFLLDALPGERPVEGGLVNHGYVGDLGVQSKGPIDNAKQAQRPPSSADSTSGYFSSGASCSEDQPGEYSSCLSVSVQLRQPEIMLFADLSEHSSHALLMRTELMVDYSRHPGRDSLVCSLASLQILSKLQGINKQPPHLVLYPCDIEFAKSVKNAEDGVKITATVSPIDIHLSASTVLTVTSVIEDVSNTFQTEEVEMITKMSHFNTDLEDLWSPRKIQPYILTDNCETFLYTPPLYPDAHSNELLTIAVPKLRVVLEMEDGSQRIPVLLFKSSAEASAHNWSKQLYMKGEVQLQASYYNNKIAAWEPLIEPSVDEEHVYRPWEVLVKVFQAKAFPVSSRLDHDSSSELESGHARAVRRSLQHQVEESDTSADEAASENGMTFIRRHNVEAAQAPIRNINECERLIGYPEDSDSENEEGVLEKLAGAIGHLFTGDSSDGGASESEDSSGAEPSLETEEASEITMSCGGAIVGREERAIFLKKHNDSVDSGLEAELPERLATYVIVDARDRLEVTLTPAALHVCHDLALAFTRNCSTVTSADLLGQEAPLDLVNRIGPGSKVTLFTRAGCGPDGKERVVMSATYDKSDSLVSSPGSTTAGFLDGSPTESEFIISDYVFKNSRFVYSFEGGFHSVSDGGASCEQEPLSPVLGFPVETVTKLYKKVTDERIRIEIDGFDSQQFLAPQRTVSKLHALQPIKNNTRYHVVVSNLNTQHRHRRITVRSPLQVKNETSYAMGLYYKKSVLDALGMDPIGESTNPFEDTIKVAIVEPDETLSELASELNTAKDIHCSPKEDKDATVFSIRVRIAMCVEGEHVNRASRSIPNYLIRLLPPMAMHNRLPYAVEIKVPSIKYEVRIEAGEKANIYFLNLLKIHKICVEVPSYLGSPWTGAFNLTADLEEKTVAMVTEYDTEGGNKQLGLSLKVDRTETCNVYLHAPYWIINKTGLPLQIRGSLSDVVYEAQSEEPLLFCYKKHKRRCVRLRAYHSSWSSAFSLDTVGCAGLVVCKDHERKRRYRILLNVTLSQLCPQLTRIVTLLPNFLVTNHTRKHLRFMEENERADLWIDLPPGQNSSKSYPSVVDKKTWTDLWIDLPLGQCIAFWPETDSMRMLVKFRDSKLVSQHFPITHVHQTVLRMDKGCGLEVEVNGGGEQPFSVVFNNYSLGEAPVRVDNLCEDLFLKIHQQDLGQVALLSPYQSLLYTWDDPCKERVLFWNVYNNKCKGFLGHIWKDGYGQERVSFHTVKQPSVSTATPTVTAKLSASLKRLSPKSPVHDGSSSSDDTESDEQKPQQMKKTRKDKVIVYWVSYLEGKQRVMLFTQDERIAYHARYIIDAEKSGLELFVSLRGVGVSLGTESARQNQEELAYISLTDSSPLWEVNVAHRWKPLTLELASWIEDKWRQDQKKAQMKDYVHVDFEKMHMTKPFYGELRRSHQPGVWLQYRRSEHLSYLQCRLYRLQVDNQLSDAVFPTVLCPASVAPYLVRRTGPKPCVELVVMRRNRPSHQPVYKFVKMLMQEFSLQLDKGFLLSVYDLCSQWQTKDKASVRIRSDIAVVHVPISAIAAKVKGIKLKMAYLEQKGCVVSPRQQMDDVYRHYLSQLLQQFHVLVLGLDVLGNPYGLITDFTEGLGDFFYEPFLGVMEGSEEFAEGLSYGAQSLLGHVVGGTAGSVSLISSSLADIVSNLSFDQDYKKKRKFGLQQTSDLPETFLISAKTFVMGVSLGLSGVLTKPIIGANQEGVEGFFKGVGKGLMGLMTKPTGGVLDCISMALDGIKRASEMGEDVTMRMRLPRYMNPLLGLKPYSVYEATGMHLLNSLSKGHYADSDIYWTHGSLGREARVTVLISLQHVFLVEKCRLWGSWDVEWCVRVDDIMAVPHIAANKLVFKVRQDESFDFFSGDERYVESEDTSVLEWLQSNIETVMILNMEDKPCPGEV